MLECVYWKVIILQIWYTKGCLLKEQNPFILDIPKGVYWLKKCLLNEKVPTSRKCAYWIKMCLLAKKGAYWMKKCILTENVPIEKWKCTTYCSVFLNVYMLLIYVVTWSNEQWSTQSQTFRFYIILVANPCNAWESS